MKRKRAAERGSNNNIDIIYSSIPDYSILKKLDFITLSIYQDQHLKHIYSFLEANTFRTASDLKLKKGNYDMKRTYKSDTDISSVDIFHGVKKLYCPSLLIRIHDPNRELLSLLDSFFRYYGISPKLSLVEFTFDFSTDDRIELFEFLKSHLFLKNARTRPYAKYSTTFYTNDIRKSSKGMRLYLKGFKGDDKKMVRMELVLKKSIIRRLGLEFPLSNIDSPDLSKFFSFNFLNWQQIQDYLYWKYRHRIEKAEKRNKRYGSGLVKAGIRGLLSPYRREESLMEKVGWLKSDKRVIPNYSRFLEPLDRFNSHFWDMASRESFIQGIPIL